MDDYVIKFTLPFAFIVSDSEVLKEKFSELATFFGKTLCYF